MSRLSTWCAVGNGNLTRAEYARHRNVSRAAVTYAVKSGRITLEADGKIDPRRADQEWLHRTRERASAVPTAGHKRGNHGGDGCLDQGELPADGTLSEIDNHPCLAMSSILTGIDPERVAVIEYDTVTGSLLTLALPDHDFPRVSALNRDEFRRFVQGELRRINIDTSE